MNFTNLRNELLQILKRNSVCRGQFVLASGAQSDLYIDAKQTTQDPMGAILIGRLGWEIVKQATNELSVRVDAIGGLTMGADPIALPLVIFPEGTRTETPPINNHGRRRSSLTGRGMGLRGDKSSPSNRNYRACISAIRFAGEPTLC